MFSLCFTFENYGSKKIALAGLGLALIGKRKLEDIIKGIDDIPENSEKELNDFFEKLIKEGEKAQDELNQNVKKLVDEYLDKMELVRKQDLEALEKRIEALEKLHKHK